jgi:hypothetical protein
VRDGRANEPAERQNLPAEGQRARDDPASPVDDLDR